MGTEADYLTDQLFDRKHNEYGDELPPVRSKPLLVMRHKEEPPVICNKAKKCKGSLCLHRRAHDRRNVSKGECCTKWGSCFEFPDGQDTPVRCTKI